MNGNDLAVLVVQPLLSNSGFALLHSHTNRPDIGMMFDNYLDLCYNLNVVVVAYDYPGYGLS